jgi:hypothetical protein
MITRDGSLGAEIHGSLAMEDVQNEQASGDSKGKSTKRTANSYSTEEWKIHRPTITKMYFDEGRTLKEVRDYLEREYGFTPR